MKSERLVEMANDIASYFRAEPDRADAVRGVATHIRKFWEPRMRRAILDHLKTGGEGLDDLAREALATLEPPATERAAGG